MGYYQYITMDDYNLNTLYSSRDELCSRFITIITPLIIEGLNSIFKEAVDICKKNGENSKYLMTFQNYISRIPKWNPTIIEQEKKRIISKSGCNYLEDLITGVHIIQLKLLTCVRVGQKQKKININIPKIDDFIHRVYINVARKIFKCVYLYQTNIPALEIQKNNREIEIIVQECILKTIRDSIPVENILKIYLDETIEEEYTEEITQEVVEEKIDSETFNKQLDKIMPTPEPVSIPTPTPTNVPISLPVFNTTQKEIQTGLNQTSQPTPPIDITQYNSDDDLSIISDTSIMTKETADSSTDDANDNLNIKITNIDEIIEKPDDDVDLLNDIQVLS